MPSQVGRPWRKVLVKARHQGKLVTNQRNHLLNQHKDMVQHQVKETRLLEPRLHHTNAGTTRAAGETSRGIPLPESLRLEKGDPKGKGNAKGKERKGKAKGFESKGKEKGKETGGKRPGKTPPPPPPAKKRPLVTEPGPSRQGRSKTLSTHTTRSRTLNPRPQPVKPGLVRSSFS